MNIMLSLNTMGTSQNAAIVAIGAVCFNPGEETLGERFYQTISLESSVAGGGVMDAETVLWWLQQSEAARYDIITGKERIESALYSFADFIAKNLDDEPTHVWGNGVAFDNVILAEAYRRHYIPQPWDYRNDRCYRTIKSLNPTRKIQKNGTGHNALDDAVNQAIHLMDLVNYYDGVLMI